MSVLHITTQSIRKTSTKGLFFAPIVKKDSPRLFISSSTKFLSEEKSEVVGEKNDTENEPELAPESSQLGGKANENQLGQFVKENEDLYSVRRGLEPKDFPKAKYLGKNGAPFPLNPLFKHCPPLSESTKNEIFQAFMKNPKENTPRVIATGFKVSIRRVEAILKLKHLELDMIKNKGFKPLLNYELGMSKILGAGDKRDVEELEPINVKLDKPIFKIIDEDSEFSPKDAAVALNRTDFKELTEEALLSKPFSYHGLSGRDHFVDPEPTPEPIANDPKGTHKKFNYIFSDINPNLPPSERVVLIREKNGILRQATKLEIKQQARNRDWPGQEKLFVRTNNQALKPARVPSTLNP